MLSPYCWHPSTRGRTRTCRHTRSPVSAHVYTHAPMHTSLYTHSHIHTYALTHTCARRCTRIYTPSRAHTSGALICIHTPACTHATCTHTHSPRLFLPSLIPRALQGMKLTSEEFNAIFTFYDKVRQRAVWEGRAGAPPAGEPPTTGSSLSFRGKEGLSIAPLLPAHHFASEPTLLLGIWEGEDPLTAVTPSFAASPV